jgi:hypothetical protein
VLGELGGTRGDGVSVWHVSFDRRQEFCSAADAYLLSSLEACDSLRHASAQRPRRL